MSDTTREFSLPDEVYDFYEAEAVRRSTTLENVLRHALVAQAKAMGWKPPSLYERFEGVQWAKPKDSAPLWKRVLYLLYSNPERRYTRKEIVEALGNPPAVSVGTAIYKLRDEGKIEGNNEPLPGQRKTRMLWVFRSLT